uniref:Uncharacterized protein n=1 Tax=Polytomella parva TaxID=51329 RepID=A0A7S0V7M7_9CHLO|mmetsp:Transcript_29697/g.54452  ORF Transcript_29697/g.54452 Transcript_29697/m.54452 type:complete len:512 (+) Transcript_29697:39-1574(+)
MIPEYSIYNRGYGSSTRRTSIHKKIILPLSLTCFILLIISLTTWRGNVRLRATIKGLESDIKSANQALSQEQVRNKDRKLEYEQLDASCIQTQKRFVEASNSLSKKDAELRKKDGVIKMLVDEKESISQQVQDRYREYQQHVDALQRSLTTGDEAVAAYQNKIEQMEVAHHNREKDWIYLSNSWREYEEDLQDHITKLTSVVDSLSHELHRTIKVDEITGGGGSGGGEAHLHPSDTIPKVRPESDFDHIHVDIPKYDHPEFHTLESINLGSTDLKSIQERLGEGSVQVEERGGGEAPGSPKQITINNNQVLSSANPSNTPSSNTLSTTLPSTPNPLPSSPSPAASVAAAGPGQSTPLSGSGLSGDDVDQLMEALRRRRFSNSPHPFKLKQILHDRLFPSPHSEQTHDERVNAGLDVGRGTTGQAHIEADALHGLQTSLSPSSPVPSPIPSSPDPSSTPSPSPPVAPPDDFHQHHDESYAFHQLHRYHYEGYDPLDHYWIQGGGGDAPAQHQ